MRLVVALGGNALSKRGQPMTAETQRANVRQAASSLAELILAGHEVVVTHGNGPQVGMLALQSAAGPEDGRYPLDILGAETEGMIGYIIEQELRNLLPKSVLLATLLTQVRVEAADPAFAHPSKPIGPVYDEPTIRRIEREKGWQSARDGDSWRRVVASPEPLEILELGVIRMLLDQKVVVICTGGGGIPVIELPDGRHVGVEAVIDKDRASGLLARQLDADMLMMLTDVDAVYLNFGLPDAHRIARADTCAITPDQFASGSMAPKIDAAIIFAEATGRPAAIGRLEDTMLILAGEAGTIIEAPHWTSENHSRLCHGLDGSAREVQSGTG